MTKGKPSGTSPPSTRGSSSKPVAMYMLLSYVAAPTPGLLNTPVVHMGKSSGKGFGQLIEERGIGKFGANYSRHPESVTVPDAPSLMSSSSDGDYRCPLQVQDAAPSSTAPGTCGLPGGSMSACAMSTPNGKSPRLCVESQPRQRRGRLPASAIEQRWTYTWRTLSPRGGH